MLCFLPMICVWRSWQLSALFCFGHSIFISGPWAATPSALRVESLHICATRPLPLGAPRVCSLLVNVGPPWLLSQYTGTNTLTPVNGHGVAGGWAPCH